MTSHPAYGPLEIGERIKVFSRNSEREEGPLKKASSFFPLFLFLVKIMVEKDLKGVIDRICFHTRDSLEDGLPLQSPYPCCSPVEGYH